jgi:hypothetical protein
MTHLPPATLTPRVAGVLMGGDGTVRTAGPGYRATTTMRVLGLRAAWPSRTQ